MINRKEEHSKFVKLYSFSSGATSPTSIKLVEEMISHLDESIFKNPNSKFLDPCAGTGTFGIVLYDKLLKYHDSKWILDKMIFMVDTSRVNYDLLKKLGFVNVYNDDFLKLKLDMKFDVAVANYPYGDSEDSGGTLWGPFTNKVNEILNDNGVSLAVHPPSFIGKHLNEGNGKSDYSVFKNNQMQEIHIFDDFEKNKYFKGVGTKVCWYILKKQSPSKLCKVVGYDNGKTYEFYSKFENQVLLPQVINEKSISIHNKIISQPSLKFIQKRKLHYHTMKKKNQVCDNKINEFKYKSYFSHLITRYSTFKFEDYDDIKVMIPQTSTLKNSFYDNKCNVSEDLFYIKCKNDKSAKMLLDYLNSPLVQYIGKVYRPGRNLGSLLDSGIIPDIENNINLTQEELEYIENYVG